VTKETDIAWLAGIIDGEGCFSVKNPVRRGTGRTCHQVWLVLCNTSRAMVERAVDIIEDLGCKRPAIRRVWKGKKATRYQFWVNIAQKDDLLVITEALLPHLTAKRVEAEVIAWFMRRACSAHAYKRTELDRVVLSSLSAVKRCGGEAPAEIKDLLREVIPNEAFLSYERGRSYDGNERVETRELSLNDNAPQECPTPDQENHNVH
jgi:hypothetical protein